MSTTVPSTTWTPASGYGELTTVAADTIVDASSNNVADSSSNTLATATSSSSSVPKTTWSDNEGS